MNDFKFVDEKYTIQNTTEYRLSIQVNPDGFSVLMCDDDSNILKIIHQNTANFEDVLKVFSEDDSIDILKRISFKEINILINTTDFALVPEQIYENDTQKIFLSHNTEILENDIIKSTRIDENNSRLIFKINQDLQTLIKLFKNSPNTLHLSNSIIPYIFRKTNGDGIVFYSTSDIIYVSCFKDKKLLFFNAFHYSNEAEMIFHAVNCYKKLQIDSHTKEYYYGHLTSESEAYQLFNKYFPNLEQFEKELSFGIAGELNENYFSNLLESLDCV